MNFHLAKYYLKHLIKAKDEHSIHSPFVFEFYNDCIKSESSFYSFNNIENYRKKLLSSEKQIEIKDLGAGSLISNNKTRTINHIALHSLKKSFLAQQLFRMVNYLKPTNIIDIGTSLGITTTYLASALSKSYIYTLEGCPNTSNIAQQTFKSLKLNNITQIEGNFKNTLPNLIEKLDTIDFVFFDGNHQYQATKDYFEFCKAKANDNTCFVFDDIYWSKGMTEAWNEIKNDNKVMISIDTFYFGICFFRTNQPKQHFVLR